MGPMLRHMTVFLVLLLILLLPLRAAEKPFVRVRWTGEQMRMTYKDKLMVYHFEPGHGLWAPPGYNELSMTMIEKIKTDYLVQKDGVVYMVSDIQGRSRDEEGFMGYCGAGEEKGKGFFVFNENGEVKKPVFIVYTSCFSNIEPELSDETPPATIPGGKLLTRFQAFRHPEDSEPAQPRPLRKEETTQLVTVRVYFDESQPEKGMQIVENCILFDPSIKSNTRVACAQ